MSKSPTHHSLVTKLQGKESDHKWQNTCFTNMKDSTYMAKCKHLDFAGNYTCVKLVLDDVDFNTAIERTSVVGIVSRSGVRFRLPVNSNSSS